MYKLYTQSVSRLMLSIHIYTRSHKLPVCQSGQWLYARLESFHVYTFTQNMCIYMAIKYVRLYRVA